MTLHYGIPKWAEGVIELLLAALLAMALMSAGGCRQVVLSPGYSAAMDNITKVSAEAARRAEEGRMSVEEMKSAIRWNAIAWETFRRERDGIEPGTMRKAKP